MAMNINNLKILVNVADAGSITRAAETLYITQPAVSKAVKSIEEDLDVRIFFRDKKSGLSLTDTGEKIVHYARQMLAIEEQIHQISYLAKNLLEGTVHIASLPSGTRYFLAEAYAEFHEAYPGIHVEITEGTAHEVLDKVSEHQADFGISFVPGNGFASRLLMKDEIVALCKEEIPGHAVDLERSKTRFYACPAAWQSIKPALSDAHVKDIRSFQVINSASVRTMAEKGLGIGLQGRSILPPDYRDCHIYPIEPPIRTDLALVALDFAELTPAASRFIAFIKPVA